MTGNQHIRPGAGSPVSGLLWFRADHPESEIETEMVISDSGYIVVRAILRTSDAGAVSGHGSASRDEDGPGFAEIAEDRALTRALLAFGYTGEPETFSVPVIEADLDDDDTPVAIPSEMVPARTLIREDPPPPVAQEPISPAGEDADEDPGANVNWTKFWNWARPRGYTNARELSELLGVENVTALTPREVRQMIVRYEMDNPPGGPES